MTLPSDDAPQIQPWPDCMLPDGAEPCAGFRYEASRRSAVAQQVNELTEQLAAERAKNEGLRAEVEHWKQRMRDRIEQAALSSSPSPTPPHEAQIEVTNRVSQAIMRERLRVTALAERALLPSEQKTDLLEAIHQGMSTDELNEAAPSPTPLQEAVRLAAEQVVSDWHDGKDMFDSTHELSRALSRLSQADAEGKGG